MKSQEELHKEIARLKTALRVFQKPAIDRYKLESDAKGDPDYEPPYFRVMGWIEGRTLSADDIVSLQCVLADANDEIGENTIRHYECMKHILYDLGGQELVDTWEKLNEANRNKAIKTAMARMVEHTAKIKQETNQ